MNLEAIKTLWEANEKLLAGLRHVLAKGVRTNSKWEHLVAVGFGRCIETFKAVQILCNPNASGPFWIEGFILTRMLYESYVTMKWISLDPKPRADMFTDEFDLKLEFALDHLSASERGLIAPEASDEIKRSAQNVRDKHGTKRMSLMPNLEAMAKEVDPQKEKDSGGLHWEYNAYYRDVSGFAHASVWGLFSFMAQRDVKAFQLQEVGYKALLQSGVALLRWTNLWNQVFHVMKEIELEASVNEWEAAVRSESKS